ncbi:hypothetical protein K440DRAFT_95253 [Wilcoxina mikolae CBS 423.85]|nr:hypothetical protein K440DRAFT_95253 [Wilcoxina mikolae CBS 423.85]
MQPPIMFSPSIIFPHGLVITRIFCCPSSAPPWVIGEAGEDRGSWTMGGAKLHTSYINPPSHQKAFSLVLQARHSLSIETSFIAEFLLLDQYLIPDYFVVGLLFSLLHKQTTTNMQFSLVTVLALSATALGMTTTTTPPSYATPVVHHSAVYSSAPVVSSTPYPVKSSVVYSSSVASASIYPSASGNSTSNPKPSGSAVPSAVPEGKAGMVLPGMLSVLAVVAAGMVVM